MIKRYFSLQKVCTSRTAFRCGIYFARGVRILKYKFDFYLVFTFYKLHLDTFSPSCSDETIKQKNVILLRQKLAELWCFKTYEISDLFATAKYKWTGKKVKSIKKIFYLNIISKFVS